MRTLSTRLRLTLWYAGLLTVILVAFGAAVYLVTRQTLYSNLDESIEAFREVDRQDHLPYALTARAESHRCQGDLGAAREDLAESVALAERTDMRLHEADARIVEAKAARDAGNYQGALQALGRAQELVTACAYGLRGSEVRALQDQLSVAPEHHRSL